MLPNRGLSPRATICHHLIAIALAIRLERSDCWSCTKNFLPTRSKPFALVDSIHGRQRRLDHHTLLQVAPALSVSHSDDSIYNCPELYDLAFGYRDFEAEVEFLLKVHRLARSSTSSNDDHGAKAGDESLPSLSVLELAAGPAQHALTALRYADYGVSHATALDISSSMASYALALLDEDVDDDAVDDLDYETSKEDMKSRFNYVVGDMRNFTVDRTFDTAWILLGSMQHTLTTDDAIACFQSAHGVLKPGGTLIVELPHPQEVLGVVECTRNEWTVPLDGLEESDSTKKIMIVWGDEDDPLDPISQVRDFTVGFRLLGCEEQEWKRLGLASPELQQVVPMRLYTAGEVEALARCSGFRLAGMYGALEPDDLVDVKDEELAFRMVCVLQKV
jgi:SAM-dependent methyltransferase